jgi:uncharacterized membrane protein YjdF
MYFIEKYYAFWLDTFNLKKIIKEGGHANYLKLTNIFIFWYMKLFLFYAALINNLEFIFYILIYSLPIVLLNIKAKKFLTKYFLIYFAFSIFLVVHLVGGIINIGEVKLYDYYLLGLVRYDWFVHTIGGFLSALVAYDILERFFEHKRVTKLALFLIIVGFASGFGAFNEILEFMAVIFLDAGRTVGDYQNNATDLVNNLVGASIASFLIIRHRYYKK